MKRFWVLLLPMLFALDQLSAQTFELFPRYTVVDIPPKIVGDKSLEQLQSEFQEQANEGLKGKVRVDFLVLPSGAIGDCRICYTQPEGNENLAFEGRKFVASLPLFTPGVLSGEKVRTWKYVILNFGGYKDDVEEHSSTLGKIYKKNVGKGKLSDEVPFEEIEQMPSFPGGVYSLMEYLSNNIHYPEECVKQKIEGRVLIEFVVESNGGITSLNVKQPIHPLLDEEALRVIRIMPRWFPAISNKVAVRVKYTVPVTFRL